MKHRLEQFQIEDQLHHSHLRDHLEQKIKTQSIVSNALVMSTLNITELTPTPYGFLGRSLIG
jgi:hypothetical protein